MKAVIQRVNYAICRVNGNITGQCNEGFLIMLGVHEDDTEAEAEILAQKISKMRIFTDENDKMNLSIADIGGGVLCISNFTLCADARKGTRPNFMHAMKPERANELYELFMSRLSETIPVEKGAFGEHMDIESSLHGPITIVLDTNDFAKKV